jgi:hypothetical protein
MQMPAFHEPERRAQAARDSFIAALDACNRDLERLVGDGASDGALRAPVQTFIAVAHQSAVPPERVLAAFKMMLRTVAAIESRVLVERTELSGMLVRTAIEAYYDGQNGRASESP